MTSPLLLEHFDELISTPDDVEKLNASILDLAVLGKLVEQNKEDSPASQLVKQIQIEKEKLAKNGIKPDKSLAPIKDDEIPFDIPDSWIWIRLGDLGFTQTGSTPPTSNRDFYGNEYPFVRPADISDDFDNSINYRLDDGLSKLGIENGRLIKSGSIMMVCIGSVGKVGFVDRECSCNQQINVLTPYIELDTKLITMFMRSAYFQKEATNRASKTTLPILNKSKWASIPIPLPPLPEQQRIFARIEELFAQTRRLAEELANSRRELDRLDESALAHLLASETSEEFNERWSFIAEHFDLLTSAPEHIAPLRQSILELAVRGKLTRREAGDESAKELLARIMSTRPEKYKKPAAPDIEGMHELPNDWVWASWDMVLANDDGAFRRGPFGSTLKKALFVESGYKVYEQYCPINDDPSYERYYISEELYNKLKSFQVRGGDYLISCSGVTLGRITRIPEIYKEGVINQALLRVRINGELITHKYFVHIFRSPFFQRLLFKNSTGSAIPNLKGVSELKKLPLPIPPLAEQERIVKRLEQLLGWCDALEAQLAESARVRGRLVESVLAGVGI